MLNMIDSRGCDMSHVDSLVVLAVMAAQRDCCAYSGMEFHKPHLPNNVSYRTWLLGQQGFVRVRCPVPVRPDPSRPFSIDNMVFVGEPFAMIYEGVDEASLDKLLPEAGALIRSMTRFRTYVRFYEEVA